MKIPPRWITLLKILTWGSLREETFILLFFPNKTNVNGDKVVEMVGEFYGKDGGVVVMVLGAGSISIPILGSIARDIR